MVKDDHLQLFLLFITAFLNFICTWMVRLVVPLYANELGASYTVVGIIVGAFAALSLFFAVPAGGTVDRFGIKPTMLTGFLGIILSWGLVALVPGIITLFVSQILAGVAQLMAIVACQTAVGAAETIAAGEIHYGWFTTFSSLGQLVGPLLGGVIADLYGYRMVFLAACGVGAGALSVTAMLRPFEVSLPRKGKDQRPGLEAIRSILADGTVRLAIVACFAAVFTQASRLSVLPLYLAAAGNSNTAIATIMGIQAGASLLVRPVMGWAVDWLGRYWLLITSVVLLGAGTALFPLAGTNMVLLVLFSIAIGFGFGFSQPITMVMVADGAVPEKRGLALGVRMLGNRLAQTVNPLTVGALADLAGFVTALVVSGLFLFGTLPALFRWRSALTGPRDFPLHKRSERPV